MSHLCYNMSMKNIETMQATIDKLKADNAALRQKNAELEAKLEWFMQQLRLSKHKQYGRSSELVHPGQLSLFNEAESEAKPAAPEPVIEEVSSYKRRKQTGHRENMLKDLPVETVEYTIPAEEQVCPCCGDNLNEMSTQVRKELKVIPPQVVVVEHVQHIYACRKCQNEAVTTPVIKASMPNPVIPGSLASASSIAFVMDQKFVQGSPLYRQEKYFSSLGIELSRQTLSNWIIKSTSSWLVHLYNRMKEHLIRNDIVHADETTLQVLKEPDRPVDSTSYMWLYRTGKYMPPIILYDYQETRHGKHPKKFLEGFKGYLCVDGYDGYNAVPNATLVGCWAHARRKFDEAIKSLPSIAKGAETEAQEGLNFCNRLYKIDHEINLMSDITPERRHALRLERITPVLNDFYAWLKYQRPRIRPKSTLGVAINYCINQWDKLNNFLKDGRLELDNNISERSIKPFVIGRKNWLFSNTPNGAKSSAIAYSIVETARNNGLNVFSYLTYVFEKLPNIDINDPDALDSLLPWSDSLPDSCKKPN